MRRVILFFLLISSACVSEAGTAVTHDSEALIRAFNQSTHPGKAVYEHFCDTCHAKVPQIPLGAPPIGDMNQWQSRLKNGLPNLLQHLYDGYHVMPARGGCFECSDKLLEAATLYMLPQSLRTRYEHHH